VIRLSAAPSRRSTPARGASAPSSRTWSIDPVTRTARPGRRRPITENTRAAYPLDYIDNAVPEQAAGHPKNIVFLTCDASGVMPPIARLTPDQAIYHFISGYTSKIAGTEIGPRHRAGDHLQHLLRRAVHGAPPAATPTCSRERCCARRHLLAGEHRLDGGPFGVGKRISIRHTRALLNAALDGKLATCPTGTDPVFGFEVPDELRGRPGGDPRPGQHVAQPRGVLPKYDALAARFIENFKLHDHRWES
jgi:phosphoenolpyruvate carboxykinase (ATP)